MVLTPILILQMSIPTVQLLYGGLAAVSAVFFVLLARENPPTPPCPPGMEARALMLDGLKNALTNGPFWLLLFVSFVGFSIFNGVTTWVEDIIRPRGFTPTDAGTVGALMLVGGILGAVIMPSFSDKQHKRVRYLLLGMLLAIPGLVGFTFATSFWLLLVSAFALGFFLVSISPIAMQYAAEITYPTPEGTSNGLIQLFGQASVVFVYVMEAMRGSNGSFTSSLLLSLCLIIASALVITRMKDPDILPEPEVEESIA